MSELLPCPFCGSDGAYEEIPSKLENGIYYQACCSNEDCTAYQFLGRASARKTDAAKLWNTRYDDWQPEEKAPKGVAVLVDGGVAIKKTGGQWYTLLGDERPIQWEVKRWKPLPQPPKDK